jgi:hypothetical protein
MKTKRNLTLHLGEGFFYFGNIHIIKKFLLSL